jgi:recombinational DNA repair ATPase RecF
MVQKLELFTGKEQSLEIRYQLSGYDGIEQDFDKSQSIADYRAHFSQKLFGSMDQEIYAQSCLFGPHREDWTVWYQPRVSEGSKTYQPLKGFASQGEVRSALLSLKLAEIDLFFEESGRLPLFLLDDFSSELDRSRREQLLDYLLQSKLQVFITSTEEISTIQELLFQKHFSEYKCSKIQNGTVQNF